MLNFLRKLRRKEMKSGRYLKYAFGEIFLVVIGILVALGINNWNEDSKERAFEKKMLSEIHQALQEDIEYFENNVDRLSKLDSSINSFLHLIEKKAVFIDSNYNQTRLRSYYLLTGIIYSYNPGPYEALKATGVDKIRNDSLRKELIRLYDFSYPRHKEFVTYYDLDYKKETERFFDFMGAPFIEKVNGINKILRKLPADLLLNPDFLRLLDDMRSRARIQLNSINGFIPDMKRVETLLSNEVKK